MSDQVLRAIARDINLKYAGGSSKWKAGDRVAHPDGRTVQIKSGCYLDPTYGRVSNFWYWQPVNADGALGEVEHGYGWDALPHAPTENVE